MCAGCGKAHCRLYGKRWRRVRDLDCGDREAYIDFQMRRVKCPLCGVKNERLAFLSDNTRFTLRFALKVGVFMYLYIWYRATWPRYRFDQLMKLGWKVLLPLGLAVLLVTGVLGLSPELVTWIKGVM